MVPLANLFVANLFAAVFAPDDEPVGWRHFFQPECIGFDVPRIPKDAVIHLEIRVRHEGGFVTEHIPVSYTHLDVYKRQSLTQSQSSLPPIPH